MPSIPVSYPLDPTGVSPANSVIGEVITLAATSIRAAVPQYSAFFKTGCAVYDNATGTLLVPNVQYKFAELLQDATIKLGKEVYSVILILDHAVSNNIKVNYQAVGGIYQSDYTAVASLYQNVINDNRPVDWTTVLNKPLDFNPALHTTLMQDVYGFEAIVYALERVRNAIILSDVPAFESMAQWVTTQINTFNAGLTAHATDATNPHAVNQTQVGLGNVENLPVASAVEMGSSTPVHKYVTQDRMLLVTNAISTSLAAEVASLRVTSINSHSGALNLTSGVGIAISYPDSTTIQIASAGGVGGTNVRNRWTGQTGNPVFNFSYIVGFLDVYKNGALLDPATGVTATNGTSFTLTAALVAGDIVQATCITAATGAQGPQGVAGVTPTTTLYFSAANRLNIFTNTTIASTDLGNWGMVAAASCAITLPAVASVTSGKSFGLLANYDCTINVTGGGKINGVTSITLQAGESCILVNDVLVATEWRTVIRGTDKLTVTNAISTAVLTETNRATAAETLITGNLNTEISTRTSQVGTLTTSINNEVSRAQGAENALNLSISSETNRAQTAEAALSSSIINNTVNNLNGKTGIVSITAGAGISVTSGPSNSIVIGSASSGSGGVNNRISLTTVGTETTFAIGYVVGYLDVYRNGVKQIESNFTATNGTSFAFVDAVVAGEWVFAECITTIKGDTGAQGLQGNQGPAGTAGDKFPPGALIDHAGLTAPAGWLACPTAPTNISRTTYAALFANIGTTWGAGDGVTTFGMPWFPTGYTGVVGTVGTSTVGQVISHTHQYTWSGFATSGVIPTAVGVGPLSSGAPTSATGGTSNLAAGMGILKCVKY